MKKGTVLMLGEIRKQNQQVYNAVILAGGQMMSFSLLRTVKNILNKAGFSDWLYASMEGELLKGNFDVLYLDSRIVGDDPAKLKAQRQIEKIRLESNMRKMAGIPLEQNLMEL